MRVIEQGTVRSVLGDVAEVVMSQGENSACASCGLCSKDKSARVMTLSAAGSAGIEVGSRVSVEIDMPSPYLAVWLLLAQPLVLLIAGILLGMWLGEALFGAEFRGLAAMALALALVAVNYLAVAWLDRRFFSVSRARARIIEVVG